MVWDDSPNGGFTSGRPWLPVKPPQLERNVAGQEDDPGSVLNAYRAVLAFRAASPALKHGRSRFIDLPEPVLAFHRETGDQRLTCVFNLSPRPVDLEIAGAVRPVGPGLARIEGQRLALPPYGFAWLDSSGQEAPELRAVDRLADAAGRG
jgi:alpha-glucosidase